MTIWKIRCSEVVIENGILMVTLRCAEDSSQEKINWKTVGFLPVFDGANEEIPALVEVLQWELVPRLKSRRTEMPSSHRNAMTR